MTNANPNQLPVAFQLQFSDPVWRLVFEQVETSPGLFVAELRNRDAQTLTFTAVALPHGKLVYETTPNLPFHSSLIGLWNGQALYHRFDNNRLPVPTALGNVDLKTGQPRWEWPQHVLTGASADRVWAQRASLTDLTTSPVVAFRLADGESVETAENPPVFNNSRLSFPVSYTTDSNWWPVVDRFIKKQTPHQPIGPVDYLEIGDKLIFSYYFRETNDQLHASVLITDRLRTIWLHQKTGLDPETGRPLSESNAQPLVGNGSFCVWQNQIIIQTTPTCLTSYYLKPMP
jgi:hypothetical protein